MRVSSSPTSYAGVATLQIRHGLSRGAASLASGHGFEGRFRRAAGADAHRRDAQPVRRLATAARAVARASRAACGAGVRTRRRGRRLPRRADQRDSVHLRAAAERQQAPPRRPRRSSTASSPSSAIADDVLLWNVVPTHPGTARRTGGRRGPRWQLHARSWTN